MSKILLMFSNSFGHRKVLDRVQAAYSAGFDVHLVCYDKGHDEEIRIQIAKMTASISLVGRPSDGSVIRRFALWSRVLGILRKLNLRVLPDVLIVNSFEWLLFCNLFSVSAVRKIYDVADIHPLQYRKNISYIVRILEKRCLRDKWNIVVTSPWFYWDYYVKFGLVDVKNECYLIENKLSESEYLTLSNLHYPSYAGENVIIAWTGILRCNVSLKLLIDLVVSEPGKYSIWCVGVYERLNQELLIRAKNLPDFVFKGPYKLAQLSGLISGAHFIWCCDFDDGFNSNVLLPNRLYQGISSGIPLISSDGTATSEVIKYFQVGFSFASGDIYGLKIKLDLVDSNSYKSMSDACISLRPKVCRGNEWEKLLLGTFDPVLKLSYHESSPRVLFND